MNSNVPESGWVFCGGMYRAGSTLQFQITAHLVETFGLGRRVDVVRPEEFDKAADEHNDVAGLKVFKTHRLTEPIQKQFEKGNTKAVYIYRDLRDVYASCMRKREVSFKRLWKEDFLGDCVEQYRRWTSAGSVLVSRYEDVINDMPAEVARIAAFLNITISSEQCQSISDQYSLDRQKERVAEIKRGNVETVNVGKTSVYSRKDLLHENHIFSGQHGAWNDVLNNEQVNAIQQREGAWLQAHGYALQDTDLGMWQRAKLRMFGP